MIMPMEQWSGKVRQDQDQLMSEIKEDRDLTKSETLRYVIDDWMRQRRDYGGVKHRVIEQTASASAVAAIAIASLVGVGVLSPSAMLAAVVMLAVSVVGLLFLRGGKP